MIHRGTHNRRRERKKRQGETARTNEEGSSMPYSSEPNPARTDKQTESEAGNERKHAGVAKVKLWNAVSKEEREIYPEWRLECCTHC